MLPAIKSAAGHNFIFHWVNTPAHSTRETVQLLQREIPDCVTPNMTMN